MPSLEQTARAYCTEIAADPDEMVWGGGSWPGERMQLPRWRWYVTDPSVDSYERALAAQRKEQDQT